MMQTPTWTRHLEPGQIKLMIVAIVTTAILLLGLALSTSLLNNDQTTSAERARIELPRPTPNTRFLEINILPGDPRTYPVTSLNEYRFLEWNILPGDYAPLIPPDGARGTRH